ncbi:MAG: GreA/GreB family elongation factor [Candidatus Nealsonbacteria bacterium]|nr:GreA/GreB family elongation factor [Candidatus Nealsonbacteria bacterium]
MPTSGDVVQAFVAAKQRQIDAWREASVVATEAVAAATKRRREEYSPSVNEANLYCERIEQNERTIRMLKSLRGGPFERVAPGCVVTLQDKEGISNYLIVPEGGGCEVVVDEQRVTCMSMKAPVAQAILGKTAGEAVLCNGCYFVVCIR